MYQRRAVALLGAIAQDEGATMPPVTRPRMKITAALLRGDGLLHIVGSCSVHTIADPDGAIQRLVAIADGSRSVSELFDALRRDHPQIDESRVAEVVRELESAGVFENWGSCGHSLAGRGRREPVALRA
jgi:hypothetical protein